MATRQYTVVLEPGEDGWIVVHCPALPGMWTQGRTREEALANAHEAIELYLEVLTEDGQPIPEDTASELAEVAV
jgi:predicted RNase H-like HicB family nuclease